MSKSKLELLMIGLDGATFKILTPLIQSGHLPNLEKIVHDSYNATLLSTVPPVTALAWPTIMSGLNPGNHGLLSWQEPLNFDLERPLASAKTITKPMIWDLLNQLGKKTCVFNVPVTYPPQEINGVMVSGMLTPSLNSQFCYPKDLQGELLNKFPAYKTDIAINEERVINLPENKLIDFIKESSKTTQIRGQAFRWLLEREDFQCGFIVFELLDRLQHFAWDHLVKLTKLAAGQKPENKIDCAIYYSLQVLDDEVGDLLDYIDRQGHMVIVSDHGFGPMKTNIHLNSWLEKHSWLKFKNVTGKGWHLIRMVGARFKHIIPAKLITKTQKTLSPYRFVNWKKTLAYAGAPTEYGIFINVKDREPYGIVTNKEYEEVRSKIISALEETTYDITGKKVFKRIYRREELYSGDHVKNAPDIIFETESGFYISELTAPSNERVFSEIKDKTWGFHEAEGIVIINSHGIQKGYASKPQNVEDITPVIFRLLQIPHLTNFDGKLPEEMFDYHWLKTHEVEKLNSIKYDSISTHKSSEQAYSAEEAETISKRLKDLGY